jgi:hypothetical protein
MLCTSLNTATVRQQLLQDGGLSLHMKQGEDTRFIAVQMERSSADANFCKLLALAMPVQYELVDWEEQCRQLLAVKLLVLLVAVAAGDVRLFVCCNDNTIKVYSLPSMDSVTVIR